MSEQTTLPAVAAHGARRLPSVDVDSYNVELKDSEGFIGDRASKGAFRNMIDRIRKSMRKAGDDPLGDEDSDELTKAELDELLLRGEPEAAGLVHAAIEDFSQEFALIIQRFLKLKEWKDTERIAVGGGFRASRVGELVTGRTTVILKGEKIAIELAPIHNHPDEAGLIGAVHLAPAWMFHAFDALLAVDIGGTNICAGVVRLNLKARARSIAALANDRHRLVARRTDGCGCKAVAHRAADGGPVGWLGRHGGRVDRICPGAGDKTKTETRTKPPSDDREESKCRPRVPRPISSWSGLGRERLHQAPLPNRSDGPALALRSGGSAQPSRIRLAPRIVAPDLDSYEWFRFRCPGRNAASRGRSPKS